MPNRKIGIGPFSTIVTEILNLRDSSQWACSPCTAWRYRQKVRTSQAALASTGNSQRRQCPGPPDGGTRTGSDMVPPSARSDTPGCPDGGSRAGVVIFF